MRKFIVQIRMLQFMLSIAGTLYFVLGLLVDFTGKYVLLGIVMIVNLILGLLQRQYQKYDGNIVITQEIGGKKVFSLELERTPEEIEATDVIIFKVVPTENDEFAE